MPETAERLDEPSVFERQPGQSEHELRTVLRDIIELYGPMRAPWLVSAYLEDELKRVKQ